MLFEEEKHKYQMPNNKSQIKKFPLLPFAQLVYDMTRWMPWVYLFKIKVRTKALSLNEAERLAYRVINNHPVFQSCVDICGRQFEGEPIARLQSRYHQIKMRSKGDWLYVDMGVNLILGDGYSIRILLDDIYRAYKGDELEKDYYWNYVERYEQSKQEAHYANSKAWLENEFLDTSIPVRPTTDRQRLHPFVLSRMGVHTVDFSDRLDSIRKFLFAQHLTLDGFVSLCTALAIAEYCGTDEAALTWAYDGREKPEELHIVGNLHRDVPFRIIRKPKIENQKYDLIRQARNQIRSGIAHSDYPYTLLAPNNKRWNYAVNVLRVPDLQMLVDQFSIPFELLCFPQQKYAYALLDVEIHESLERLEIVYRYSASHYKEESIKKFASLLRKYAEWLLEE